MKYWDSSAVIPILVREAMTETVTEILAGDRHMHVWWATEVECVSSLSRLEREKVPSSTIVTALDRLASLREEWTEIGAGSGVREIAKRLLRVHVLRAADALQLAAASVLAHGDPGSITLVSLNDRLREAARREGFLLLPQQIN
jgi:predicted nucleic acid-binding protein